MEGTHFSLLTRFSLFFIQKLSLLFLSVDLSLIITNPQYCPKVAYHCSWFTDNPLVPVTLRSLSANLCHGRTRNYWQASLDCPQCSELYNIFNTVRLVIGSSLFLIIAIHLHHHVNEQNFNLH